VVRACTDRSGGAPAGRGAGDGPLPPPHPASSRIDAAPAQRATREDGSSATGEPTVRGVDQTEHKHGVRHASCGQSRRWPSRTPSGTFPDL
jgi:hypothetical protein